MKERLHISMLMDYYSSFLTDKQREMMRLHYEEDYSLGEIAAIYHISRQGAYDSIKKGEAVLQKHEQYLGLVKKQQQLNCKIKEIQHQLTQLSIPAQQQTVMEAIEKLLCELGELS